MTSSLNSDITFLDQAAATIIDEHLTTQEEFSFDQLMELAGLSVADAVFEEYATSTVPATATNKILTVCGPGNNGGDGLVAARHLQLFGYSVDVWYPKPTPKPFYQKLVTQARCAGVSFLPTSPTSESLLSYSIIIDAIFGYSFKGDLRAPFDSVLTTLKGVETKVPIVSVDIPSGWDVEKGNVSGFGLTPAVLISLTAPKLCAKFFRGGAHYVGGRFISNTFATSHNMILPKYPGSAQIVKLPFAASSSSL
eukprot:PhF_6_TR14142/c0_g1_i1/m.22620/K17759/AIBP, nnrE; NAD(P)H-hydrate epimerase